MWQKMSILSEESPLVTQENKKKILVMDDEDMVGEIACQMLEYLGFEAVHVTDGLDAIEEYKKQQHGGMPFTAVIMDLTIPGGMGGKEAVTEILSIDSQAKVFVSSGYSTDPIMVNFRDYGFYGGIAKPFDLEAMQKMLSAVA
jgi:CheY-like chemotaxis protein